MAPDERFFRGIDAKPVNLFFEFAAFGSPKSNFKRASQYTLPPARQSTSGRNARKLANFHFASFLLILELRCVCGPRRLFRFH
jgi:hypothetical protein